MRNVVAIDDRQFGLIPDKDTIDAVFIFRMMQEEYLTEQDKLYMRFVDLEKTFDKFPRNGAEWAMRKKELPEALVGAVIILYNGTATKVWVGTHLSEELELDAGEHQGSVLSPLLMAIVIDFATNDINVVTLQDVSYAKSLLESERLNVNQQKRKVTVSNNGLICIKPSWKKDPWGNCGWQTICKCSIL